MNWRDFIKQSDGIKVEKVEKPSHVSNEKPFYTLNTFSSTKQNQSIAHKMINRALSELDHAGRPWPLDFLARLTPEERDHLRQMEKNIDVAVQDGNEAKLIGLLTGWREFLLGLYH